MRRPCRFLLSFVFMKSSRLSDLYYVHPERALVTNEYCQSFGKGAGCIYWDGENCRDPGRLTMEDFEKWLSSTKKKLRELGYKISRL